MTTIPTIGEIRDQILADIEAVTGKDVPLLPHATWRVLATALAGALSLLYRFGLWVRRQIFVATGDDAALRTRGAELGLVPKPAVAWRGTAQIGGSDGTSIPAGRPFRSAGRIYVTTDLATISAGVATLTLTSAESGDASNLVAGAQLSLVTPLAGIDDDAVVLFTELAGEDAEATEAFRRRLQLLRRTRPQGGAIPDWVLWTTEVPGIGEAFVDRPAAGSLVIYPLTDDPDPTARVPNGDKLAEVQSYVTDARRAPIRAAAITVAAAQEIAFGVEIANLDPNTPAIRAAIAAAVRSHLLDRRPKQYNDEPSPRDVISAARITSIAISAGAEVATVTLKNASGVSITSATLAIGQLAVLDGEVVWV